MHKPSEYPNILLFILDQTHVTVTAATGLAILCTRDASVAYFGAGALGSTLLARGIKHRIRQPRPPPPPPDLKPAFVRPKRTYGMPSTHSTAIAFYYCYLFPMLPLLTDNVWAERTALTLFCGLTLWSRVELGYHTREQVLGGVVVGAISAVAWKLLWTTIPQIGWFIQDVMDGVQAVAWNLLEKAR